MFPATDDPAIMIKRTSQQKYINSFNSNSQLEQMHQDSSSSSSATTLFTDGLHLIFSFLSTNDWISSLQACHTWYRTCRSAPIRHLCMITGTSSYILISKKLPHRIVSAVCSSSSPLRRHLTCLSFTSGNPHSKWDILPPNLVQSCIHLAAAHFKSLTCLTLSSIAFDTDLMPLHRLKFLVQLTLACYHEPLLEALGPDGHNVEKLDGFPVTEELLLVKSQQLRYQIRCLQFIPNLRRLYFTRYADRYHRRYANQRRQLLMQILSQDAENESLRICLPDISDITQYRLDAPIDLDALTNVLPGVHAIQLTSGCLHGSYLLTKCTQLRSLKLILSAPVETEISTLETVLHPLHQYRPLLSTLTQISHSLEQLSFERLTFTSLDEWQRLFSSAPHLTNLTFKETCYDALLEHLTSPLVLAHQVTSLTLIGTQIPASSFPLLGHLTSCRQLYLIESPTQCKNNAFQGVSMLHAFATFNDPSFMPSLTTLTLSIYPDFSRHTRDLSEKEKMRFQDFPDCAWPARTFTYNSGERDSKTNWFRVPKEVEEGGKCPRGDQTRRNE